MVEANAVFGHGIAGAMMSGRAAAEAILGQGARQPNAQSAVPGLCFLRLDIAVPRAQR